MTNSTSEEKSLYQKRIPIFTKKIKGKFRTFKSSILYLAYGVFFGLPWIPWARPIGPQHAVSFDLNNHRFHIFDLLVNVNNIIWLAAILMAFAWLLFLVTGILGRAFCGYFCFQTLWTDAFIKIETLIQGDRIRRIKLWESKWNAEKILKVGGTWLAWLLFAFWTGFSFTAYWADAPTLFVQFFSGTAPSAAYTTILIITVMTFLVAGFGREQVCTYMCPYARFQSVMFDKDTLVITYDKARGEGTKGRAKPMKEYRTHEARQNAGYGDCIDCDLCVQVCPAGIDIREGLSYKCISCGLCVDACHAVMEKSKFPTGLIRYDSERAMAGGKTKFIKGKTIGYCVAILGVIAVLLYSILTRPNLTYSVDQVRQPLAVRLSDGRIQNAYEIKLNNQTLEPLKVEIGIDGLSDAELQMHSKEVILPAGVNLVLKAQVKRDHTKLEDASFKFVFVVSNEMEASAGQLHEKNVQDENKDARKQDRKERNTKAPFDAKRYELKAHFYNAIQ